MFLTQKYPLSWQLNQSGTHLQFQISGWAKIKYSVILTEGYSLWRPLKAWVILTNIPFHRTEVLGFNNSPLEGCFTEQVGCFWSRTSLGQSKWPLAVLYYLLVPAQVACLWWWAFQSHSCNLLWSLTWHFPKINFEDKFCKEHARLNI